MVRRPLWTKQGFFYYHEIESRTSIIVSDKYSQFRGIAEELQLNIRLSLGVGRLFAMLVIGNVVIIFSRTINPV